MTPNTRNTFPVIPVVRLLVGLAASVVGLFFCGFHLGRMVSGSYEAVYLATLIILGIVCIVILSHAVLSLVFLLIDMHDQVEYTGGRLRVSMREKYQV